MKTKITTTAAGYVTIAYDDNLCGRIERCFFCPPDGGYVREYASDGRHPQVCDHLSSRGPTLICSSREALPDLIRREYRAMRRVDKKYHV